MLTLRGDLCNYSSGCGTQTLLSLGGQTEPGPDVYAGWKAASLQKHKNGLGFDFNLLGPRLQAGPLDLLVSWMEFILQMCEQLEFETVSSWVHLRPFEQIPATISQSCCLIFDVSRIIYFLHIYNDFFPNKISNYFKFLLGYSPLGINKLLISLEMNGSSCSHDEPVSRSNPEPKNGRRMSLALGSEYSKSAIRCTSVAPEER